MIRSEGTIYYPPYVKLIPKHHPLAFADAKSSQKKGRAINLHHWYVFENSVKKDVFRAWGKELSARIQKNHIQFERLDQN